MLMVKLHVKSHPTKKICYICSKLYGMKQVLTLLFLLIFTEPGYARNEIGPEGHKLLWLAGIILLAGIVTWFVIKPDGKMFHLKNTILKRKRVNIELSKDRLYYPDNLQLSLTNTGNTDLDIDTPLLVFSGMWYKRKFKLKGSNTISFYPFYLTKGQNHTLNIDLNRFYRFDKTLKRLPRVKVMVREVNGKTLGSKKVLLRKTLFNF